MPGKKLISILYINMKILDFPPKHNLKYFCNFYISYIIYINLYVSSNCVKKMESTLRDKNIESLKKMLLSRDTNLQMKAVNLINDTFDTHKGNKDYESILQNLISSDLCSHLSEASATLDVQLLKYFFQLV